LNDFIFRRQLVAQKNTNNVNMRYFLIFLTTCFFMITAVGQSAEDSVKATVNKLFASVKNADGRLLRSTFADSAILQTIAQEAHRTNWFVVTENVDEFAKFVNQLKKDSADERIRFETIKIDGPLAIVWTPYEFYYNGQFSHCGVNSFQLVRLDGEWKIQYLIDTRRRKCK
jgi:hypothetical protein